MKPRSDALRKARYLRKFGVVGRGISPDFTAYGGGITGSGIAQRTLEHNLEELYDMARRCNPVRKAIQSLMDNLFKEGYEWEKLYSKKCNECEYEHPPEKVPKFCARCGSLDLSEPDEKVVQELDKFFERVDRNGHSLLEVLQMFEHHLCVADDSFIIVVKDYKALDDKGRPTKWDVKELFVADPRNFHLIIDDESRVPGGKYWVCIKHRPTSAKDEFGQPISQGKVSGKPGRCTVDGCGLPLHDVWYTISEPNSPESVKEYFLGDIELEGGRIAREVIHKSKFHPSYGFGHSPLIAVFNLAATIIRMEEYVKTFYDEERTPRAALVVATGNPQSFQSAMRTAEDKNVSTGGHNIPKFTFSPSQGGPANPIQYIEMSKLPAELQMVEQRREYYQYIGAAYDTTPIFLGINDSSGMQNQGPLQWRVTKLGAQKGQRIYNDGVFPQLLEQLGSEGWRIALRDIEDIDEMQDQQIEMMKLQVAQMRVTLGFEITGVDAEGNLEFSEKPLPMGGQFFGGGGGGFGAPGGQGMGMGDFGPPGAPSDEMEGDLGFSDAEF